MTNAVQSAIGALGLSASVDASFAAGKSVVALTRHAGFDLPRALVVAPDYGSTEMLSAVYRGGEGP